jgi:hypothetical protein
VSSLCTTYSANIHFNNINTNFQVAGLNSLFESCSGHGCVSACLCIVLSCVSAEALCWTDPPTKETYQMSVDREVH